MISDVSLCYQYYNVAFFTKEKQITGTCDEIEFEQTLADVTATYTLAFYVMLVTISVSSIAYLWAIIKHSAAEWIINLDKENKIKNQFIYHVRKLFYFFLILISKILWPLTHLLREYKSKVKTHEGGANDPIHESETTWLFIKTIDNGVENFIQMYLQLYLIKPYVTKLTKLPVVDILQGIHSIYNLSDSLCKGKNVSIALGKLFLSLISLSYGAASRQASKPGISFGQTIKNLVLWLSFVCLSVARTTSIFSLVALETPIPGLVTFFLIHLLLVSLIFKIMVISCGKIAHYRMLGS